MMNYSKTETEQNNNKEMEAYLFAQGNTYLELYKLLWSY